MKTKDLLLCSLMGLMIVLASCIDSEKNLLDPENNPPKENVVVPGNFDWYLTKIINLTIDVADTHNGKYNYDVKVYTQEPKEGINPIASGSAREGEPFMQEVTVPKSIKSLYIQQSLLRPDGTVTEVMQKTVSAVESTATCRFVAITTRSGSNKFWDDYQKDYNELKAGAIELRAGDGIENHKKYYIPSGTIYEYSGNGNLTGVKILVDGTLQLNTSPKFNKNDEGEIFVAKNGKITGDEFLIGSHAELENYGTIQVDILSLGNDSELDNYGCIYAKVINYEINEKQGDNLEGDNDSYIECNTLYLKSQGATIELETGSRIVINEELIVEGKDCIIKADDSDDTNMLIQVKGKMTTQSNGTLFIDKNIMLEYKGTLPVDVTAENKVEDANGKIIIAGNHCSGSFGKEDTVDLGTYTYAMEDQYPSQGDHDMNDIVLGVNYTVNKLNGEIKDIHIKGALKAIGATKKIAVYLQVDPILAKDINVKVGDTEQKIDTNGEVLLFDDVHKAFGVTPGTFVNVEKTVTRSTLSEVPFEVVLLASTINSRAVFSDKNLKEYLSIFIKAYDQIIRLPQRDAANDPYRGEDGWVWGIEILGDFRYPVERMDILEAYPDCAKWLKQPENYQNWYQNPVLDKVY